MDHVSQLLSLTPSMHERLAFSGNKSQRKGHAGGRTNNTGDHRHWKIGINREHQKNKAREETRKEKKRKQGDKRQNRRMKTERKTEEPTKRKHTVVFSFVSKHQGSRQTQRRNKNREYTESKKKKKKENEEQRRNRREE
jgi:hypothetical protein